LTGGAERQAARLARGLADRGVRVRVLTGCQDAAWKKREWRDGYEIIRLSTPRMRGLGTFVFMMKLVWFLLKNAGGYNLIHVFMLKHEALASLLAARLVSRPVVLRPSGAAEIGDVGWAMSRLFGRAILYPLRRADAFVALSRDIANELTAVGFPRKKIHVIPNGVEIPREPAGGDSRQVVFLGRLAPEKNLTVLLDAWRTVIDGQPLARLVICGEGPERPRLEALVTEYGLEHSVNLTGFLEDPQGVLRESGVFVLPSASEGMSAALVEAMAAGLALCSTEVSGSRDIITHGENGFLVEPGNPGVLAECLLKLLKSDDLRRRFAMNARKFAESNLDAGIITDRHIRLYDSLMKSRAEPACGKTRVVHVIATLDGGGSERQMAKLVSSLDRKRFETSVICLTRLGPIEELLVREGIEARLLGKRGKLDPGAFLRLCAMLRGVGADVAHTWLFTSNAYGRAAAVVARVGNIFASERSTDPWKGPVHQIIDRFMARFTKKIFANCEAVRDVLVERKIPEDVIALCPNMVESLRGVSGETEALRSSLGIPKGIPVVGYVGRLSPEKGLERLLDTHEIIRRTVGDAMLVIVGDGALRCVLEKRAERIGGVVFTGYREDARAFYPLFDVLVLLSDYEGSPNSVLEALAMEVPVVASDVGSVGELALKTGAVVSIPGPDSNAAAVAVVELLGDAERRKKMGRSGGRYIADNHAPEKIARMIEKYYLERKG